MKKEAERNYCHTAEYGIALLRYLQLTPTPSEKSFIQNGWARIYNTYGQNPIDTLEFLYGNLPMLKSGRRRVESGEFESNRLRIEKRIKESEAREKYESGDLDEILRQQESLF
jgi:hypothetical protein